MNILLMMLANCMYHWDSNRLWSRERLRWKILKKQKTEKDPIRVWPLPVPHCVQLALVR